MDRRFLSDRDVIAASRQFVCIRLATYESAVEAEVLASIFVGRSGALENTTFAILAPDGRKLLARAGRSPEFAFGGADGPAQMAATMQRIAKRYRARARGAVALPSTASLRLGLNIAACDHLPLVVTVATKTAARARLEEALAGQAWSEAVVGRFVYATVEDAKELAVLDGAQRGAGYLVVEPGRFGLRGKVIGRVPVGASPAVLAAGLAGALKAFTPTPDADIRSHRRAGRQAGAYWTTEIPVTDPGRPPPKR
jgi:hypothetical protein